MEENEISPNVIYDTNNYEVNKYVLKSPILIGLSQKYFFQFFAGIFIDLVLLPILALTTGLPTLSLGIVIFLLLAYYAFLKIKRNKYGDRPIEHQALKKQEKFILFDNANIFFEQSNS